MIEEEAARLAGRLLANEEQAYLDFQRIYRRLFLAMFRAINLSDVESEDLASSAITDISLIVAKWNSSEGNFDGWVRTVARNMGFARLRENAKSGTVPLVDEHDRSQTLVGSTSSEREQAVHDALAGLSPSDRVLIDMRELDYEQEKPYSQIAETLARARAYSQV